MALIVCPHCQKTVSDSRDICIHCGNPLKADKKPPVPKTLTFREMQTFEKEFDQTYPVYRVDQENQKDYTRIQGTSAFAILMLPLVFLTMQLIGSATDFQISEIGAIIATIGLISVMIAFVLGIFGYVLCSIKLRNYRKKMLYHQKIFHRWLYEKKGLKIPAQIDKNSKRWEKRYFSDLDVSNEKL